MKSYLKHVSAERARLRHPAFAKPQARQLALEVLQKQPGIAGVKPGPESFLLYLEADANLDQICLNLEKNVPELAASQTPASRSLGKKKRSFRKAILKTYLACGITTVSLGALGFYHWHKFFGWIFTAFAIEHVWTRRKAL